MGASHLQVNESSEFVEICVQADHEIQTPFEVVLSTSDVTAVGKNSTFMLIDCT